MVPDFLCHGTGETGAPRCLPLCPCRQLLTGESRGRFLKRDGGELGSHGIK